LKKYTILMSALVFIVLLLGCAANDLSSNDNGHLEPAVNNADEEFTMLQERLTALEKENEQLKEELQQLRSGSVEKEEVHSDATETDEIETEEENAAPADIPVRLVRVEIEPPTYIYADMTVVFENVGEDSIDEIHFVALLFDEKGYPISGRDGMVNAKMDQNLHPGQTVGGGSYYMVEGEARKAKIGIEKIIFFDRNDWINHDIEKWISEEKNRY